MAGLKRKYTLTKADGRPVDENGEYFIIKLNSSDWDHAHASRVAARAYARSIRGSNQMLAADLEAWVDRLRVDDQLADLHGGTCGYSRSGPRPIA